MKEVNVPNKKFFYIYWIFIFLCYLPVWLAFYPGIAAYDANIQIMYVMEDKFSTHHPILHSLYLGGLYKIGRIAGTSAMGIDWYTLSQCLIMAGIFAYAVYFLRKNAVSPIICWLCALFYGLFPVNSILAVSTTKDVIFAGAVLLFVIGTFTLCSRENVTALGCIKYVSVSVLMLLFRSNAFYAWLLSMIVLIFLSKDRRKLITIGVMVLVCYVICSKGLILATGAEKASPVELLSVPAQQMARVGYYHEEVLENTALTMYIPEETIENYNPYLADNVKFGMNAANVRGDKLGFVKMWISLGCQYPKEYIIAFFLNCEGFWNIADTSHTDIYNRVNEGLGYLMDVRLSYDGQEIGEGHSYFPSLQNTYHRLFVENGFMDWPFIHYIFAPAFWWWALAILGVISLYKKRYSVSWPIVFLTVYYISLLFGPTCLVRYIYPIMVCIPLLYGIMSAGNKKEIFHE